MQKSTRCYFCITLYPATPGGGGWQDGAAAGVFQIITSGCGGGGSPWQPQCLQHPTTEGNRATEQPSGATRFSCCGLRNPGARANRNDRGTISADIAELRVRTPRRWWNWINNHGLLIRECTFRVFCELSLIKYLLSVIISFHGNISCLSNVSCLINDWGPSK